MKSYLERARIARAVKVRVMDEWGIAGRFGRSISPVRSKGRVEPENGLNGNGTRQRRASDPGPQFLGKRLEPAT